MKNQWWTNYKRRYYFINLNECQQAKIWVKPTGVRFKLELVDEKTKQDYTIACSNNMQILKDLIHAVRNGLDKNHIRSSFHMLQISNLEMIL